MTRSAAFVLLCAITSACASAPVAEAQSERRDEIPCLTAPFTADASLTSLQQALGAENVVEQAFETEGDPITIAVIYPRDEARRIEVAWRDETNRRGIYKIGVGVGSQLSGPHGLRVGASIAAVEQLNGKPFDIRGFGWDFGGDVADWRGGAFSNFNGCRVNANFAVPNAANRTWWPDGVVGDRLVESNALALQGLTPTVSSITYVYPDQ